MNDEIDWIEIEREYRLGVMSVRSIGAQYGVSEATIRKRAKRDGWSRDLSGKVKARAEEIVRRADVRAQTKSEVEASEREQIEIGAKVMSDVIIAHRSAISRSRNVVLKLLAEIEHQTDNQDIYERLGEILDTSDADSKDKLNDLYMRVIGINARVSNVGSLALALKNLVGIERQAFGMSDGDGRDPDDSTASKAVEATTSIARRAMDVLQAKIDAAGK